jgi:hypothetical protein
VLITRPIIIAVCRPAVEARLVGRAARRVAEPAIFGYLPDLIESLIGVGELERVEPLLIEFGREVEGRVAAGRLRRRPAATRSS